LRKIKKVIQEEGVRGLFSRLYYRLKFRLAGVDFVSEELPADARALKHGGDARPMVSTSVHLIYYLMTKTAPRDMDITEGTFVDLGCGKGGPLYAAHKLGFQRVVGVEFTSRFYEIACDNMKRLGATDVEVRNGDAADFQFPTDLRLLFMFNPFGEDVMRDVCLNLAQHVSNKYLIFYDFPMCRQIIESELAPRIVYEQPDGHLVVYEIN
jgi:SAM-dependent methyltransferase